MLDKLLLLHGLFLIHVAKCKVCLIFVRCGKRKIQIIGVSLLLTEIDLVLSHRSLCLSMKILKVGEIRVDGWNFSSAAVWLEIHG